MKAFMGADFLLQTETAKRLYHNVARELPVIDYHCHVSPREIFENKQFENITEVWLGGDHYKWRLMRANGIAEYYITGDAPAREKFQKFAETLPKVIGNPMYHWCHLELKNYFGYEGVLNGDTAQAVWDLTCQKLSEPSMGVRGIIEMSNVAFIGTTDDPVDDLMWHQKLKADDTFKPVVAPFSSKVWTSEPASPAPETCSQVPNADGTLKVGSGASKNAGTPSTGIS